MRLGYYIYGTKLFLLMFNVRKAPRDDNIMKKGWKMRKPPPEKADLPIYVFRDKDLEVRGMVLQKRETHYINYVLGKWQGLRGKL